MLLTLLSVFLLWNQIAFSIDLEDINLPVEHIPYFFNSFPNFADSCSKNISCRYKSLLTKKACWGYETSNCNRNNSYHVRPRCLGDHRGWVKTKEAQYETFYTQADFGEFF